MDLQEVRCVYRDWIGLAQNRDRWRTLVSAVMNLRVQWNAGKFLTSCKPVSFSRRTLHHGVSIGYAYRMAQQSVTLSLISRPKCVLKFFITYSIYKDCSKLDSPCIVHKSQRCVTTVQITDISKTSWLAQYIGKFRLIYYWFILNYQQTVFGSFPCQCRRCSS